MDCSPALAIDASDERAHCKHWAVYLKATFAVPSLVSGYIEATGLPELRAYPQLTARPEHRPGTLRTPPNIITRKEGTTNVFRKLILRLTTTAIPVLLAGVEVTSIRTLTALRTAPTRAR